MADRIVVEVGDVQLEVIAREKSELDKTRTREVELSKKLASDIKKALAKLLNAPSDNDK